MKFLFITIRNYAEIDEPGSPELSKITLPLPPKEAIAHIAKVVEGMPRWQVEAIDSEKGTIHLTRRTRLWRFIDDIHLKAEKHESGSRLHGNSKGRIGLSDFGQNRRNLSELVGKVKEALSES